ncbi:MAG: class I SAM-dependent methyltransferase [Candidatus Nanopelagicales bacterium]
MPMNMSARQGIAFREIREKWLRDMLPLAGFGPSELISPLPLPDNRAFDSCRLLTDRRSIIERLPRGGKVAEVGTQEGIFGRFLLDTLSPEELHLFDIDLDPLHSLGDPELSARAIFHEGDSSTLLGTFPADYFDVIYVDGDHSYDGAKRDAEMAVTRLKPGGYLIFNDFTIWSPVECIDYGVPYVVCEVINDHGWPVVFFALHPLGYHDIALQRPGSESL